MRSRAARLVLVLGLALGGMAASPPAAEAANGWTGWYQVFQGYVCGQWMWSYGYPDGWEYLEKVYTKAWRKGTVEVHTFEARSEVTWTTWMNLRPYYGPSGRIGLPTASSGGAANTHSYPHHRTLPAQHWVGHEIYLETFGNQRQRWYATDNRPGCPSALPGASTHIDRQLPYIGQYAGEHW